MPRSPIGAQERRLPGKMGCSENTAKSLPPLLFPRRVYICAVSLRKRLGGDCLRRCLVLGGVIFQFANVPSVQKLPSEARERDHA